VTDCEYVDNELKKLGLPTTKEMQPDPAKRTNLCAQLAEQLRLIVEATPELDEGGQKVRVGNRHIPLSRSSTEFIQLGAELGFAWAKHDPIEAGGAVVGFFVGMYSKITKLTEVQRMIYVAIKEAIESKKLLGKILIEDGVSAEELSAYFARNDLEVPTLVGELKDMTDKKVLTASDYGGQIPYYQLVF
jgi:hypothetical protein